MKYLVPILVGLMVNLAAATIEPEAPSAPHTDDHAVAEDHAGAVAPHGDANGGAPTHGATHGGGHDEDPSAHFNWFEGVPFGYKSHDVLGGPLGDGKEGVGEHAAVVGHERQMNAPFILMFVNFGILIFLLVKFAGPAATKAAETRSDTIKNALAEAARLRSEAANKLAEYKTKLADADAQIKSLVAGMRADAEADKNRMLAAADAQAQAMQRDAESRISAEITRAKAQLTAEVAAAATIAAEKLLRERATGGDHAKLVDTFIADLMTASTGAKEPKQW